MFDMEMLGKTAVVAAQRVVADFGRKLASGGDATALDQDFRAAWLSAGDRVIRGLIGELGRQHATVRECACPDCGKLARFKKMPPCTVRTVLTGEPMEVASPYFVCADCRRGVLSLCGALGLDADGFTRGPPLQRSRELIHLRSPELIHAEIGIVNVS